MWTPIGISKYKRPSDWQLAQEGYILDEQGKDVSNSQYGKKRPEHSKWMSENRTGENNPCFGVKQDPELIRRRVENTDYGDEYKEKMSESLKKHWETADKEKFSKIMKEVSKGRKSPDPQGHINGWATRRANQNAN
jgi:hypothetical protein